jgi:ribosomal protein S27AE
MEQYTTNATTIDATSDIQPVVVIEPVVDIVDATNKIAQLVADEDFFGTPPDELAYDAHIHLHTHTGIWWPFASVSCEHVLIDSHRSKKDGLVYYVELESVAFDDSELATFYRVKAEKKSDVDRLKAKCEARCGKVLKIKKEKLKP